MQSRYSVPALLGVVAVSVFFGVIVGGKINAPRVAQAAPRSAASAFEQAPTDSGAESVRSLPDFAAVAERSIPAVVQVRRLAARDSETQTEGDERGFDDPLYRWFFGPDAPHPPIRRGPQEPERSSGSGFIVSKDGYIMTNGHVVANAAKVDVVMESGETYEATVVGADAAIDLALLKIDAKGKNLPTLPLGNSDDLRVGEWVMAIGNPLNFQHTVTVGVVSGKQRNAPIGRTIPGLANIIQTDAAINFGNSGGPLLDAQGRVVGISTAIIRGQAVEGIGFAIAINEARAAAEQIRETGTVQRGFLGIGMNMDGITEAARLYYGLPDNDGVLVDFVEAGGPASKAGIQPGDVIRTIDGQPIKGNRDLLSKVGQARPGDRVRVEILRDGKPLTKEVVLAVRRDLLTRAAPETPEEEPEATVTIGLGIEVTALTEQQRRALRLPGDFQGVLVENVDAESPAFELIGRGAIIQSLNDRPIGSPAEWARATRRLEAGTAAKLEIRSEGGSRSVFVIVPGDSE